MTSRQKFWLAIIPMGLAGAALLAVLISAQGWGDIARAVSAARGGLLGGVAFEIVPLTAEAPAWWILFPPKNRLHLISILWMRWVGKSVSTLLPAAQIG